MKHGVQCRWQQGCAACQHHQ